MTNEAYRVFPSRDDLATFFDRSLSGPMRDRVLFGEKRFATSADLNEALSIERRKRGNIGNMIARDGDRRSGCDAIVDTEAGTVSITAGEVYVQGDVRPVGAALLEDVPMTGDVVIGVRLATTVITHEEDESLLGLDVDAAVSSGEPCAVREVITLAWGFAGDGGEVAPVPVYLLRNGTIIDQSPPPSLTGINEAIRPYDYDAHGNYIARGCEVRALGLLGGAQQFDIAAGTANILGNKITRYASIRHSEPEVPDLRTIPAEPHTFTDGGTGTAVIAINHVPLAAITSAIIEKEVTETVTRGGVVNTADALAHAGVTSIVEVKQGGTTYTVTTEYTKAGDTISWAPGGSEPAGGSSYTVKYRYLDAVIPTASTATTVTLTGGVTGGQVTIGYSYKLPRHDRICLDADGAVVYLKGTAAAEHPQAPQVPAKLLSLAVVENNWFGAPDITTAGTRSAPYDLLWRYLNRMVEMIDLIALNRLQLDISAREPVAKKGVFVDPLVDDRYRDAGEAQDGAVFNGTFQIAIDPTFHPITLNGPQFLPFTEEVIVAQEWVTGCQKINPYQSFAPLPAILRLTPSEDFWTESNEVWASAATQVFGIGNTQRVVSTNVVERETVAAARFLRQIPVAFRIEGFGEGEVLDEMVFDGLDVTPGGPLAGDANGVVTGSFTIPAGVASGTKAVRAVGEGGTVASSTFRGEGRIETITRQRVTMELRFDQPAPRTVDEVDRRELASGGRTDPVAQTFMFTEDRHISSIDVKFCAIGDTSDPVIMEIVTVENGWPTTQVIAQTEVDMRTVLTGAWTRFAFSTPVFIPAGIDHAIVLKTNSPDHSVSIGRRGGYDQTRKQTVGAQPYMIGVLLSSSNALTWTPHQDEDLTMRIKGAVFAPTTKVVSLGIVNVTDLSDLIMEAQVYLPTGAARVVFEAEANGPGESAVRIERGQVWERQSYFTGQVALRAILTGTSKVSPIMSRDVLAILGKMRASGTYVSRAMTIGTGVRWDQVDKTRLPAGSTLTVEYDKADNIWTAMPQASAEALADGTFERTYRAASVTGVQGRLRLTLTGTPAARPAVSDLRAFTL